MQPAFARCGDDQPKDASDTAPPCAARQVNMVMKFGGSSVASAERMLEVAEIVCSFPDQLPVVVLSAMGKVSCSDQGHSWCATWQA